MVNAYDHSKAAKLRRHMQGAVLTPDDSGYDTIQTTCSV